MKFLLSSHGYVFKEIFEPSQYRHELIGELRRELQERDIPERRWDGTLISAGVVEDSSGKLTSTNLLGNMYVPICRLTVLAGSMIRGLIWALGEMSLCHQDRTNPVIGPGTI